MIMHKTPQIFYQMNTLKLVSYEEDKTGKVNAAYNFLLELIDKTTYIGSHGQNDYFVSPTQNNDIIKINAKLIHHV